MALLLRFPTIMAWLVTVLLVGGTTTGAALGLRALATSAPVPLRHVQGLIVAVQGSDEFALSVPGRSGVEWFRVAPSAHISMAHLRRHEQERAPTDITYATAGRGMPLAWTAD
jgi:hypothetical protein